MKILIEFSIKRGMVVVIFHCGLLFSSFSFSTLYSMEISVAKSNSSKVGAEVTQTIHGCHNWLLSYQDTK